MRSSQQSTGRRQDVGSPMATEPNSISQGDVLQHAEWVRRLALALVRNAHDADELAQETCRRRCPGRRAKPGRCARGWLAWRAISRACACTSGRRARREESVAQPEPEPTPEELVARVEMQQEVARRAPALREPFRSTLLLRYYEGCRPPEIARRQDVPAGTVRWRLKQGLGDPLRQQLDDAQQGDWKRWARLLAPLPGTAISPHLLATAPGGGSTVLGIIAMKTIYKIGLVVIVVLFALLAVVGYRHVNRDRRESVVATSSKPPPKTPAAVPTPHVGAEQVIREDDPTGSLRLEGQVIDGDEKPVGGAIVAIDTNPPRTVTTEADGSFTFDHLIGREYKLEASAGDGYAGPAYLRLGEDQPGDFAYRARRVDHRRGA